MPMTQVPSAKVAAQRWCIVLSYYTPNLARSGHCCACLAFCDAHSLLVQVVHIVGPPIACTSRHGLQQRVSASAWTCSMVTVPLQFMLEFQYVQCGSIAQATCQPGHVAIAVITIFLGTAQ